MHWLGPSVATKIWESRVVRLEQLNGILCPGWVNGAQINLYIYTH